MKSFRGKLRDAALSASTIYLHYALGLRLASHNFPSEIFSFVLLAISIKPCHTQSMAAVFFLDSAKNLSQIALAELCGIALTTAKAVDRKLRIRAFAMTNETKR